MKRNDPISHLMTRDPFCVQRGQPISEVRRLLAEHTIHHVPVVDGKRLVGMVSSLDLVKLAWGSTDSRWFDAIVDHTKALADVMSADPVCLRATQTVREAAEVLAEGKFHGLPVVDVEGNLVGIVTSTDLIRYLLAQY